MTYLACLALLVALLPSLLLRPHATIMRILPELLRARSRKASVCCCASCRFKSSRYPPTTFRLLFYELPV